MTRCSARRSIWSEANALVSNVGRTHRLAGAARRRSPIRSHPAAGESRRLHRTDQAQGSAGDRRSGPRQATRSTTSCSTARGLGKTTLAAIIARELDVKIDYTSGPVLQKSSI
ncbi:MAG: hypothetical protein R2724_12895 [Bryobacterales bacterium]